MVFSRMVRVCVRVPGRQHLFTLFSQSAGCACRGKASYFPRVFVSLIFFFRLISRDVECRRAFRKDTDDWLNIDWYRDTPKRWRMPMLFFFSFHARVYHRVCYAIWCGDFAPPFSWKRGDFRCRRCASLRHARGKDTLTFPVQPCDAAKIFEFFTFFFHCAICFHACACSRVRAAQEVCVAQCRRAHAVHFWCPQPRVFLMLIDVGAKAIFCPLRGVTLVLMRKIALLYYVGATDIISSRERRRAIASGPRPPPFFFFLKARLHIDAFTMPVRWVAAECAGDAQR